MRALDSWDIIMLDSEAADNAESKASEVEQLRATIARYEEEHKLMSDEIAQLKEMLKREVSQAEAEKKTNLAIINDYKIIRQRLDIQLKAVQTEFQALKVGFLKFSTRILKFLLSRKKLEVARIVVHTFWKNQMKQNRQKMK